MVRIHSTVGKQAKRMPDTTVETTPLETSIFPIATIYIGENSTHSECFGLYTELILNKLSLHQ